MISDGDEWTDGWKTHANEDNVTHFRGWSLSMEDASMRAEPYIIGHLRSIDADVLAKERTV